MLLGIINERQYPYVIMDVASERQWYVIMDVARNVHGCC